MFERQKPAKKSEAAAPEWFTLSQMALAFDMTPAGFHKTVRPLIPEADVKGEGERGMVRIRCRGAIDAYAAKKVAQVEKKPDPLLSGTDSPELERYRKFRADLAELELGERNGSLIPKAKLEPTFTQYAAAVRRAGESLQREFGNAAIEMLNSALDDAERIVFQAIGTAA